MNRVVRPTSNYNIQENGGPGTRPARAPRAYLVDGDPGEGGAAIGVEPGIVPGDIEDDDGGAGGVPGGTLIGGSVVLGIADGEMPLADTGSEYGD